MSDNFYLKRRSVLAKKMRNHPIKEDDLQTFNSEFFAEALMHF